MIVLAGMIAVGSALGLGSSPAKAHEPVTGGGPGVGGYPGGGYGGGGYPGGAYGGGGYGVPGYSYYGNGGHDAVPHWHTKRTPFGTFEYFGTGRHDFRPHQHTVTPYGIESHNSPRTRSYSPPTPYIYRPW
jgi:hypothetical protein